MITFSTRRRPFAGPATTLAPLPFLLALVLLPVAVTSRADDAPADCTATGRDIMQRVHDRERGERVVQRWNMTLRNERGETRDRSVRMLYMTFPDGHERRLIRFLSPPDIRDTTFLNVEVQTGTDDQYLYLPAYRRTKRISNTERNRSFMGTDYTYEDILTRNVDTDAHTCEGIGQVGEWTTFRVRSIPREESSSQYKLLMHWVDSESNVIVKTLFYEQATPNADPAKEYLSKSMQQFDGVWIVTESTMTNLVEGHSTRIEVDQVQLDHPEVTQAMFTRQRIDAEYLPDVN